MPLAIQHSNGKLPLPGGPLFTNASFSVAASDYPNAAPAGGLGVPKYITSNLAHLLIMFRIFPAIKDTVFSCALHFAQHKFIWRYSAGDLGIIYHQGEARIEQQKTTKAVIMRLCTTLNAPFSSAVFANRTHTENISIVKNMFCWMKIKIAAVLPKFIDSHYRGIPTAMIH